MKSLVAYASKTGVTRECAEKLAALLPECTLCDITNEKPDPNPYDIVVIGSCVRMGALQPAALEYLDNCQPILLNKVLGVFICCASDSSEGKYISSALSPALLEHSEVISFGGKLDPSAARGFDRFLLKTLSRMAAKNGDEMLFHPERIPEFAAKLIERAG